MTEIVILAFAKVYLYRKQYSVKSYHALTFYFGFVGSKSADTLKRYPHFFERGIRKS